MANAAKANSPCTSSSPSGLRAKVYPRKTKIWCQLLHVLRVPNSHFRLGRRAPRVSALSRPRMSSASCLDASRPLQKKAAREDCPERFNPKRSRHCEDREAEGRGGTKQSFKDYAVIRILLREACPGIEPELAMTKTGWTRKLGGRASASACEYVPPWNNTDYFFFSSIEARSSNGL